MPDMLLGLHVSTPSEIYEELTTKHMLVPEAAFETKWNPRSSLAWRKRSNRRTPTLSSGSTQNQVPWSRPRSLRNAFRLRLERGGNWIWRTPSFRKASRGVWGHGGIMGAQCEHIVFSFGWSLKLQYRANMKYRSWDFRSSSYWEVFRNS